MNISLDFDKTYTEDPHMWDLFIALCKNRGYDIRIVTFRNAVTPIEIDVGIPVIYTSYVPKREFTDKLGWHVDIWIDDSPEIITQKSDWTEEDRELWAQEKKKQDEIILNRQSTKQGGTATSKDDTHFDVV